jgi:hypothetical protein
MNKIVRMHYPVEKLPEDLRAGLDAGAHVTITIVTDAQKQPNLLLEAMDAPDRPMRSRDEINSLLNAIRRD